MPIQLLKVAQTFSLLYRRLSSRQAQGRKLDPPIAASLGTRALRRLKIRDTAGRNACATHRLKPPFVAQTFSLLYRRLLVGSAANSPLTLSLLCALALTGQTFAGGIKTGDSFPDLAGFKLEGKLPDSTKGKVVLVDFWASWCEPCKQSFPVMEELHKRYSDRGLVIIAVNVDENRPDMETFLKKNAASFTVMRDAGQKLVEKTGIATMPSSFLIDRDGKVRFAHTGFRGAETKKKYEEEIESLLK